jgi:hypothetical protein
VCQNDLQYLSVSFRSGHLFYHPGRIAQENSASVHKDGLRLKLFQNRHGVSPFFDVKPADTVVPAGG